MQATGRKPPAVRSIQSPCSREPEEKVMQAPKTRATKPKPELKDAHLRRVLETTKRLLAESGDIERLTIRGLAAASDVSPATLYNRFVDKETLISTAIVDHYEREVRQGFERSNPGAPLESLVNGLKMLARTCQEHPGFAKAVVGLYFKVGGRREMPKTMYASLYGTMRPLLLQMQEQGLLQDWVSPDAICVEISDRGFTLIHRWALDEIPARSLADHLLFGAYSILLGASRATQAAQVERILREILKKPGFESRLRPKSQRGSGAKP